MKHKNDKIVCIHCGTSNYYLSKFCHECGEKIVMATELQNIILHDGLEMPTEAELIVNSKENVGENDNSSQSKVVNPLIGCFSWIIVFFAVGYIGSLLFTDSDEIIKSGELSNSELINNVEQYLKFNYLKDPDSYQAMDWVKTIYPGDVKNKYKIYNKFRARNGFGAYTIEEKIFVLDQQGNVVAMFDVDDLNSIANEFNSR